MSLTAADLRALRLPVAAVVAIGLVGAAAVYGSGLMIDTARMQLAAQESALREARDRHHKSGDRRGLIDRYLPRYNQLRDQGLVGPEQRINWLDALRIANQQARLFGVEYQITVQQPYPYAQELSANGLNMSQSLMKLTLRLAHEGELMPFFDALAAQKAGFFDINQCVIGRLGTPGPEGPRLQPNLRADCELAWITLNPDPESARP